jgi:hypothetical protein
MPKHRGETWGTSISAGEFLRVNKFAAALLRRVNIVISGFCPSNANMPKNVSNAISGQTLFVVDALHGTVPFFQGY